MEEEETLPETPARRAAAAIAAAAEAAATERREQGRRTHTGVSRQLSEMGSPGTTVAPPLGASRPGGSTRHRSQAAPSPTGFPRTTRDLRSASPSPLKPSAPCSLGRAPSRACQGLRALPVCFLMLLVLYLDVVYVAYHCLPQLQLERPPGDRDARHFRRGTYELLAFSTLTFLFLLSYWLAVMTPAGAIPATDEWTLKENPEATTFLKETKKSGGQRACKWCCMRKPDRAHHCRVCRACVLKMDHHCPWIFNCVGWGNHKYFMLSLLWGATLSIFVASTMMHSVRKALYNEQTPFDHMFMLLFAETLDVFLCTLISGFLLFHLYLVANAVTTIEFCEKQFRRLPYDGAVEVVWSRGLWNNFVSAFGDHPLLWFFPVDNRGGDGTVFEACCTREHMQGAEQAPLSRKLSASRMLRGFDPVLDDSEC